MNEYQLRVLTTIFVAFEDIRHFGLHLAHALTGSVILVREMSSNVQATLQNFFGFTLRGAAQMMRTSRCHVGETKGVAVAAGRRREAPGFARNCWRGPLPGPRSTGPVCGLGESEAARRFSPTASGWRGTFS